MHPIRISQALIIYVIVNRARRVFYSAPNGKQLELFLMYDTITEDNQPPPHYVFKKPKSRNRHYACNYKG